MRSLIENNLVEELKQVNANESKQLAKAFLGVKFLENQEKFAREKGKTSIARTFSFLLATRPLWSLLL